MGAITESLFTTTNGTKVVDMRTNGSTKDSRHTKISSNLNSEIKVTVNHAPINYLAPGGQQLSVDDADLLWLIANICFRDRTIHRHRALGWSRNIEFKVQVNNPILWKDAKVHQALIDCLSYLTGDRWVIDFEKRPNNDAHYVQTEMLPLRTNYSTILPFSGGVDSFATAIAMRSKGEQFIPVTAAVSPAVGRLAGSVLASVEPPIQPVSVKMKLGVGEHAEPTYRTRTLMYFAVAALAARYAEAKRITISEPGQGALSSSMITFANEHPVRTVHPGFTSKLESFLRALWGESPIFDHPNIWSLKSDLVKSMLQADGTEGLLATKSCSRRTRQEFGQADEPQQCGICSACLLRRMSFYSAGIPEGLEQYLWNDLFSPGLEAEAQKKGKKPHPIDIEVSSHAVLTMKGFADLRYANKSLAVERATRELAPALRQGEDEVLERLNELIARHDDEFTNFLDYLGKNSWVRHLAGR